MLNHEESEALYALQTRVNELTERLEMVETAGRSLFDILPYFIQKRIAAWRHPTYLMPLTLNFDSTPERKKLWDNDTPKAIPKRVAGYHKREPDSGGPENKFREIG